MFGDLEAAGTLLEADIIRAELRKTQLDSIGWIERDQLHLRRG